MKQQTDIKISATEIKNIVQSYEIDTINSDDDRTYSIKKALEKIEVSDKIIYLLYLELGTKTAVAEVLGISRISATRIIKRIENNIKELVKDDGFVIDNVDNSLHN